MELPLPFAFVCVLPGLCVKGLVSNGIFASLEELLAIRCVGGEQTRGLGRLPGGFGAHLLILKANDPAFQVLV